MSDIKTIQLIAKIGDRFSFNAISDDGGYAGNYTGSIPAWMPGEHFGDYLMLHIDVETGQITNWNKPTQTELWKELE